MSTLLNIDGAVPDDSVLGLPKGLYYHRSDRQGWGVWTTVRRLVVNNFYTGLPKMSRSDVADRSYCISRTRSQRKRLYFIMGNVDCFCVYQTWVYRLNAPDKGKVATHQWGIDNSKQLVLRKNPQFELPLKKRRSMSLTAQLCEPVQLTVDYTYEGQE